MSWILDVVLLALIAGTIIFYSHRGFIKTVLGFGRTVLGVILAWFLGPKLGMAIVNRFWAEKITEKVYNVLCSLFDAGAESFDLSALFDRLPEAFLQLIRLFGADLEALEAQFGAMTAATRENLTDFAQSIAQPIMNLLGNFIGFALVFFGTCLAVAILSGILSKIFELPVLKQINGFLGFALGVACAVLNALVFCTLSYYVIQYIGTVTESFDGVAFMEGAKIYSIVSKYKFF